MPDYTVGWICALPTEMAAAQGMLDQRHDSLPQHLHDHNTYTLGRIGSHNIVLACLPAGVTGTISAGRVAMQMLSTFKSLRFGLMVGIGGGVPSEENDIRLGDVVVSKPTGNFGGVIQYDFGKTTQDGRFTRTGLLNKPPDVLLTALANLQAKHLMKGHELSKYLSEMMMRYSNMETQFAHPGTQYDLLYEAEYDHPEGNKTCSQCNAGRLVDRKPRPSEIPVIHYGLIASGDQVIRHGATRDRLRRELDVLCFEMEAAGLVDSFPCLVIRGVCDYADSHKNKLFQAYAAATSAAYARELLSIIPGKQVIGAQTAAEMTTAAASSTSIRPIFSVPFERDKQFTGRKDILSRLEKCLQTQYRVALHGLGGVGKSQIAIEYAYRFLNNSPQGHVFWVYAANVTRFEQAYKEIARKMKIPRIDDPDVDICGLVSEWLNEDDSGKWLMILDNADNPDLFFRRVDSEVSNQVSVSEKPLIDYLPRKLDSERSLIITTRNRQLGEDLSNGEPCIEILPFAPEEARELLRSKAGSIADSWSDSDSDILLRVLGCIPLAITQAAAFMRRNGRSLQEFLKVLEKDEQNFKDYLNTEHQDHRRERGIPNSVFRTWKLSFDQIRTQEPRAAAMLSLMAMLDRQQIPEKLIRRKDENDVDFFTAIGTLSSLSLITKEAGKQIFAIHRLVQLSVHDWLEQHNQKARSEKEALALLVETFPNSEHENPETCESSIPHAQAVLGYEMISEADMIRRADLLYKISRFDMRQGRYNQAYKKTLEAYNVHGKLLGQEDSRTLNSLSLMALVLRFQGKYGAAEEMGQRVLEGYEKALGAEHPNTLISVSNLALVFRDQGKYETAEKMSWRALKGKEKVLGAEHPDILISLSNLAWVLRDQGKYKTAEEMNRRALKGFEKTLGAEHPNTLTSVGNLAEIFRNQGKYKAAEEMYWRALKEKEKALGAEHPNTLTSVSNLAGVLGDQEKYETAEEMNRRALKGFEKTLGAEHPNTLTSVRNLAEVLRNQGNYEAAEEMGWRALKGFEKTLGAEHPNTLISVSNLALVFRDQGKYETAEKMSWRALKGKEKVLGAEHHNTLTSVRNLAEVFRNQGKYKAAEEMYWRALKAKEKALGAEHPSTLTSLRNLAKMLRNQGKYETAEEMGWRMLKGFEKTLGVEHPNTLISVRNLAEVLRDQGKYETAEEMNRRALNGFEKAVGAEHPETLTSVYYLAYTLHAQRQYDDASVLYQRAAAGCQKMLGPYHPTTQACSKHYASMLDEMNRRGPRDRSGFDPDINPLNNVKL